MDRRSSPNNSAIASHTLAGAAFEARPVLHRMTRSLEFLVHAYIGQCLMLCRRDKQEFLGQFPCFRAELEPLLAAADVAIDAYETLESVAPRSRKRSWRRFPAMERLKLRDNFLLGSRLFAEFMSDVRRMRAEAREQVKQEGEAETQSREFLAWAKPILRDPIHAARVFDGYARHQVAVLSNPEVTMDSSNCADRLGERRN